MGKRNCSGRRDFLKVTAAGAAGIALTAGVKNVFAATRVAAGTAPLNKWPGRVIINFNKGATPSTPGATAVTIDADPTTAQIALIKTMMDDSIKLLTGQTDLGTAWKSIFPATGANAISLTSKIAIKLPLGCCTGLRIVPWWYSVQPIVNGLTQMNFGTVANPQYFPAANITFYDNHCANEFATCGYNATNFPGVAGFVYGDIATYADGAWNNAGAASQYSTTLHNASFLINIFSPRGHYDAEFFSLGFKNHYGTYPTTYHDAVTDANPAGQTQSPYLRNIACMGPVYNKTVLLVCGGLFGLCEGYGAVTAITRRTI